MKNLAKIFFGTDGNLGSEALAIYLSKYGVLPGDLVSRAYPEYILEHTKTSQDYIDFACDSHEKNLSEMYELGMKFYRFIEKVYQMENRDEDIIYASYHNHNNVVVM